VRTPSETGSRFASFRQSGKGADGQPADDEMASEE
jgi:hypothetical protein